MLKLNSLRLRIAASFVALACLFFGVKAMHSIKSEAIPTKLVNQTWYFTGDLSDDPELASNYSSSPSGLPPCGVTEEVICQIEAPDDGTGKPKMDEPVDGTTVQLQIREAHQSIADGDPQENTTVKAFREE